MTAQKKTTKQILVKVSLGIVLTVSTIGFIFSDFQAFSLQGDTNIVRTVNDIPIKTSDITQEREGMARLLGAMPQDAVLQQQIIDQAFENITLRTVISSYTDIQGILASENEVAKIIHSIPVFHGADGQFDGMLFKNILQSQGVSVKQFKYNIAQNIARESFTTPIATEFPLSQKIIKSFNDFLFTTIDFTAYHVDYNKLPEGIKKIDIPTDTQLKHIYKQQKSELKLPILKNIEYAVFDGNSLRDKITITDEKISDFYIDNKDNLYTNPEKRHIFQVVVSDEKQALDLYAQLKQATDFQKTAQKLGYKLTDIDLGFIPADEISDKAAQEQVFTALAKDILKPIKTDFGYAIYYIENIQPISVKPFDTVKQDIKDNLFKKSLSRYLDDIMPKIDDDLAGGADLAEITQKYGSKVIKQDNIMPNGVVYNSNILNNPKTQMMPFDMNIPMDNINQYDVGDDIPLIIGEDNTFTILKITDSQPERLFTFQEVKQSLTAQEVKKQKETILKNVIADLKNDKNKEEFCKKHNIRIKNHTVTRSGDMPAEIYYPKFNKIIFAKNKDTYLSHINNTLAILVGINAINPPSKTPNENFSQESDDFTMKLQKNYDAYIQTHAIDMLRNTAIIETDDDVFNAYLARENDNEMQ